MGARKRCRGLLGILMFGVAPAHGEAVHIAAVTSASALASDATFVQAEAMKTDFARRMAERDLAEQAKVSTHAQEMLGKDVASLTARIDSQDKRMDDQNNFLAHILTIVGLLLSFLAILAAVAGLAGYFTVRRKAVDEAREVAKAETSTWFEGRSNRLEQAIKELYSKLEALEADADARYTQHQEKMRGMEASVEQARKNLQDRLGKNSTEPLSAKASLALAESASAANAKPEGERDFNDWNNSAFEAYRNNDKELALSSWLSAYRMVSADPQDRAGALYNAALACTELERPGEAIAAYNELIEKFSAEQDYLSKLHVARAMLNRGVLLSRAARNKEAAANYEQMIDRIIGEHGIEFEEQLANSIMNLSMVHARMHNRQAELAQYDRLISMFGGRLEQPLRRAVAMALVNYGAAMQVVGDSKAEQEKYGQVVDDFGSDPDQDLKEQVGKAMLGMAISLGREGDRQGEVEWCNRFLAKFELESSEVFRSVHVNVLGKKAVALSEMQRHEEALQVYGAIRECFSLDKSSEVDKQVCIAMFNEGVQLDRLDRKEEELRSYDEALARLSRREGDDLSHLACNILANKAVVLEQLGRNDDKLAVYEELISRYGDDGQASLREFVVTAMLLRASSLMEAGRSSEALQAHRVLIERFSSEAEKPFRHAVLLAHLAVARELTVEGEFESAVRELDMVILDQDKYGGFTESMTAARIGRGFAMLSHSKRLWSDVGSRTQLLESAMVDFVKVTAISPDEFLGWQNRSYCLYLMAGDQAEVETYLRKSLELGGADAVAAALSDTEMDPIPVLDDEFRTAIEREWSMQSMKADSVEPKAG